MSSGNGSASVTEVGALSALVGRGFSVGDTCYGVKSAWLAGRGRCTESRPELETVNK